MFGTLTIIFDVLDEIIGKIIESRYIGICPIIDKIIDIGGRLPQIIGIFRELSAKLSISKITGELSKIYRYRKKLIAHPYTQRLVFLKCISELSFTKKVQIYETEKY